MRQYKRQMERIMTTMMMTTTISILMMTRATHLRIRGVITLVEVALAMMAMVETIQILLGMTTPLMELMPMMMRALNVARGQQLE